MSSSTSNEHLDFIGTFKPLKTCQRHKKKMIHIVVYWAKCCCPPPCIKHYVLYEFTTKFVGDL